MKYFYNGQWRSQEQIQKLAAQDGISFDEFIKKNRVKVSSSTTSAADRMRRDVSRRTMAEATFGTPPPTSEQRTAELDNLQQQINIIDEVKNLGGYDYSLYAYDESGKLDQFQTNQNFTERLNLLKNEERGELDNIVNLGISETIDGPGMGVTELEDAKVNVWYENNKPALSRRYNGLITDSQLETIFGGDSDDAIMTLQTLLPDEYTVQSGGMFSDEIVISLGPLREGNTVRLKTNWAQFPEENIKELKETEKGKFYNFLENARDLTSVNDLKYFSEINATARDIVKGLDELSADKGGTGLSLKQEQELNYITAKNPKTREYLHNIFSVTELQEVGAGFIGSTGAGAEAASAKYITYNPYEEELNQARFEADILQQKRKATGNPYSADEYNQVVQDIARQIIRGKKRAEFREKNIIDLMQDRESRATAQQKILNEKGIDLDLGSLLRLGKGVDVDEKTLAIDTKKEVVGLAKDQFDDVLQYVEQPSSYTSRVYQALNTNEETITLDAREEEEELVQLDVGDRSIIVPQSVFNGFADEQSMLNSAKYELDEAANNFYKGLDDLQDAQLAWRTYSKNYDDLQKWGNNLLWGSMDIAAGISKVASIPVTLALPSDYSQASEEMFADYQNMRISATDRFYKDLSTDDAFESVGSFGEATAQVITQQLPNLAAIVLLPETAVPVVFGVSAAGNKGIEMDYQNSLLKQKLINGEITLDQYTNSIEGGGIYYSKMLGYGLTEGLITKYFGTLNTIKRGRNIIKNLPTELQAKSTSGYLKYIKDASPKAFKEIGKSTYEELIEENSINISQNLIDGRPMFENTEYVSFSSGLFGGFLGAGVNVTATGMMIKHLSDHKAYKEMRGTIQQQKQLQDEIDALNKQNEELSKGTFAGMGANNTIIENNNRVIADNTAQLEVIKAENIQKLDALEKRYKNKGFTKNAWYNFRDGLVQQEVLRLKAQDILNNEGLSQKQKEKEINQIKGQLINIQKNMLVFTSVEKFGDAWAALNMNSSVFSETGRKNKIVIDSYNEKARVELARENATITKDAIDRKAREIYNNDQTIKFVNETKSLAGTLGLNFEAFEDNSKLIKYVEDQYDALIEQALANGQNDYAQVLQQKKERLTEGFKKGTLNGADIGELDLTVVSMTNATNNGLYATSIHEISHAVFRKILNYNTKEGFDVVGDRIIELLEQANPELLIKMSRKNANALTVNEDGTIIAKDGEEVFATFLELVRTEEIDVESLKDANIIGIIGETINNYAASQGLVDLGAADFTGQDQILNTLFGIDQTVKDYNNIPTLEETDRTTTKLSETEQVSDLAKINELMPEGVETREDYLNPRVFNPIFRSLISEGGAINTYIRKRSTSQEEVDKRIEAVQDQLMKFDPQAKRKTGETVGSEAFGEFIFAEVDFGGRKARKKLAEEGVRRKREGGDMEVATKTAATTETKAKVDDRKPTLLEEKVFEPNVVEQIKTKVSKIIPTIKQKVDQVISKNKRISPFIAQAKTDISNLAEPIIKKAMGGKANDKLKNFLLDNKPSIVNNLTTTFLMGKDTKGKVLGGIPQAIQKSVGGEFKVDEFGRRVKDDNGNDIFVPKWLDYPDWVGKKPDLEKAAATGRTSGADLVRRHPNAANFVTDADILSRFFEDVEVQPDGTITVGEIIRGRKEATAKQLANEIGLEIFEEDMNQKGPMFDMFKESQLMQGAVIAENVAADMRRQIDRGDTKFSETLPDQLLDFVDNLIPELETTTISGHNKVIERALTEATPELRKFLSDTDLIYNFSEGVSGFRRPMLNLDWGLYNELKKLYQETNLSKDGNQQDLQKSLKQTLQGVNKLVDKTDFAAFAGMTPSEVTGFFLSDRGLKMLGKDNKQYQALEKKIKRKVAEGRKEKNIKQFIAKYNFDPRDVKLFNAGYGVFNKIQNILNKSEDNKNQQINENYSSDIAGANISNIGLLSYIYEQKLRTIADNPNSLLGIIRFMELNTNNVKALRALSRLLAVEIHEGVSQAPFIDPQTMIGYTSPSISNTRSKEISDRLVPNFTHPHYQIANEAAQAQVTRYLDRLSKKKREAITYTEIESKFNGFLETNLRYKGEHDFASALLNFEIGNLLIKYGNEIQKNPSQKEALIKQFSEEVKQLAIDYDQELGTKILFDVQDEAFSTTSKLTFLRSRVDKILQDNFINPINGDNKSTIQLAKINDRNYLDKVSKLLAQAAKVNNSMLNDTKVIDAKTSYSESNSGGLNISNTLDLALDNARGLNKPIKKIRVFDFDDTLARTKSIVFYTNPDGTKGQLTAEEFAEKGADLVADGAVMDFSDFNIVREGERGPMFEIAERIRDARGTEDVFVLTARAPESAPAIYEFLKSEGLEIPLKNITGLGNSTGEAKAEWMVGKAAEGYNDFYFTDDAIQNVDAVKTAMEALDVKSKTQQARIKLSETLSKDFNIILEQTTGIEYYKDISKARAQTGVYRQRKFRGFMPASAQDFEGLIYRFLGKGEEGDRQYEWFKENLLDPLNRAEMNMAQDRINLMNDFRALKNNLSVPASLNNEAFGGFKNQDVVRMYIWLSQGMDIPGLSKRDIKNVKKHIADNPELMSFAEDIKLTLKGNEYAKPSEAWQAGTITTDLIETLNGNIRKGYLKEFSERADIIFSVENLNKIEAIYGIKFRESLENSLQRIKAGRNRIFSNSRLTNNVLDYINNSAGVIMFLNMRSAVLQSISNINFLNWNFNNPLKAGQAFANQGQYWKDFMMLMNSDYLLDRRQGLRININEAEIANAAATGKNKAKAAVSWIIQKGYAPTTFMDSFAIASGGALFYRNRVNDLIKNEGLSEEAANQKAMEEFREIAEKTQQSSRPDKISQQQAGDLGRIVLAFANTPMQYNRLINKALLDLVNGRGDYKSNISRIMYYGVIQNLIFNSLQQAAFALGFGDEATDEEKDEKYMDVLEGSLDSILRGTGVGGTAIYTLKNVVMDLYERSERSRPEYVDAIWEVLSFSPPLDSKISRLKNAAWYFDSKKRRQEMLDKGFSLDNPAYMAFAKVVAATTNVPLDRVLTKINNIGDAFASDTENWMRIAILLGWPKWTLESKAQKESAKKEKDLEYKKKNIDAFNKWEQESILKQYGISDEGLKYLKNEKQRVEEINYQRDKKDTLYLPLEKHKPWDVRMREQGASEEEIKAERARIKSILKPPKVLKIQ